MTDKLVILGLGLIGGSLAAALRERGLVSRVTAWGRREEPLRLGRELGYIDDYTLDLDAAMDGAGMAVIATPTLVAERVLEALRPWFGADVILTDVASVKGNLLAAARRIDGSEPPNLVLAHPIAGSEASGVAAARPDLFVNHRVILTPTTRTAPAAVEQVRRMWASVGAEVVAMPVDRHDRILAATSHLPHLLAYTLVDALAQQDGKEDIFRFAAGGFRDFTRIASSDPTMWHEISLANRDALLGMIDDFQAHLATLREAIEGGDSEHILARYRNAKAARDRFAEMLSARAAPADPSAE